MKEKTWEDLFLELSEKIMMMTEEEFDEFLEKAGPILSGGVA